MMPSSVLLLVVLAATEGDDALEDVPVAQLTLPQLRSEQGRLEGVLAQTGHRYLLGAGAVLLPLGGVGLIFTVPLNTHSGFLGSSGFSGAMVPVALLLASGLFAAGGVALLFSGALRLFIRDSQRDRLTAVQAAVAQDQLHRPAPVESK